MLIPRRLEASDDQTFAIVVVAGEQNTGSAMPLSVIELLPDDRGQIFRGFFSAGTSEQDRTVDLQGRWVEVLAQQPGRLLARARLAGATVEAELANLPAGLSPLWLPSSVERLVFSSSGQETVIDAATVGSLISL